MASSAVIANLKYALTVVKEQLDGGTEGEAAASQADARLALDSSSESVGGSGSEAVSVTLSVEDTQKVASLAALLREAASKLGNKRPASASRPMEHKGSGHGSFCESGSVPADLADALLRLKDADGHIAILEHKLAEEQERREAAERMMAQLQSARASAEDEIRQLRYEVGVAQAVREPEQQVMVETRKRIRALEEANAFLEQRLEEVNIARQDAEQWRPSNIASSLTNYVWDASRKAYRAVSSATTQLTQHTRKTPGVYTDLESEQMITVHSYYKQFLAGTDAGTEPASTGDSTDTPRVAATLAMASSECKQIAPGVVAPDARTYHLRDWRPHIGMGVFREDATRMIATICAYQERRFNRNYGILGTGYPDDPSNLLLHEFKTWLAQYLSFAEPSPACLLAAVRRQRYASELAEANIFPPGEHSKTTMLSVLLTLRDDLGVVASRCDSSGITDEALRGLAPTAPASPALPITAPDALTTTTLAGSPDDFVLL